MERIFDSLLKSFKNLNVDMERRFFDLLSFHVPGRKFGAGWSPPTDIYEENGEIFIRVEIAGARKEDLKVEVNGKEIHISGKRELMPPKRRRTYYQMEITYDRFERSFLFPFRLEDKEIKANYANGILSVSIRKESPSGQIYDVEIEGEVKNDQS